MLRKIAAAVAAALVLVLVSGSGGEARASEQTGVTRGRPLRTLSIAGYNDGNFKLAGIKPDGTLEITGPYYDQYSDYYEHVALRLADEAAQARAMNGLISVSSDVHLTAGLRADGTVAVAVSRHSDYENDYYNEAESWRGITAVAATYPHIYGLRADGTVAATGPSYRPESTSKLDKEKVAEVNSWTDIVDLAAGNSFLVALKADGTVVHNHYEEWLDAVHGWSDIVAVATPPYIGGASFTNYLVFGVKADGTVVYVSYDETYAVFHNSTPYPSRFEVSGWTDIVDVAVGTTFTLGLKSDGTAVLAGEREGSEAFFAEVESWSDIIAITATAAHAAGLKADGTVVLAGTAEGALNDASGWRLRAPFSVSFNGVNVDLALPTAERNGHTFYPLEGLLEALGLSVGWNAEAFTVYAENNGNTVEIPLRALGYWINGVKLDAPAELAPFVENGKTYVYLDYIIQGLEGK